jgi:hypothetical protein
MINFDDLPDMMDHLKVSNFRIKDQAGNLLFQIESDSINQAKGEFIKVKDKFLQYGRIQVQLCNDSNVAQGWKNGYLYNVFFSANQSGQSQPVQQPAAIGGGGFPGFGLAEIIKMTTENAIMKFQIENKSDKSGFTFPEIPVSYVSVLQGLGMMAPGSAPGLSGSHEKSKLTLDVTGDEKTILDQKLNQLESLIGDVLQVVDIEKIIRIMIAVKKNPKLVDSVLPFIK